jgi:hypothetical protein
VDTHSEGSGRGPGQHLIAPSVGTGSRAEVATRRPESEHWFRVAEPRERKPRSLDSSTISKSYCEIVAFLGNGR